MKLIDSHCHIHDQQYDFDMAEVLASAKKAGIEQMITVGTDVNDSRMAADFAEKYDGVYALVGIHPGITEPNDVAGLEGIIKTKPSKLAGFGDIGLDYHYKPFSREQQIKLFESQLDLATKCNLPVSFHVREAFEDFWPILDNFAGIRGTLHSYTDNLANVEAGLSRGLLISVNGIVTFNHNDELDRAYSAIPLDRLLFETDAPYLAPKPYRGKQNQPAYIADIAQFWVKKFELDIDKVADTTTNNAKKLFNLV